MMDIEYSPNYCVQAAHNIPHFDQQGQIVSNSFNLTTSSLASPTTGYIASLVGLPAIILALGILSLLIVGIAFLFRFCAKCCTCAPNEKDADPQNKEIWIRRVIRTRSTVLGFFIFFLIFVIAAVHIIYFGNMKMNSGVNSASSGLLSFKSIFSSIHSDSEMITYDSNQINDLITASSCLYTSSISSYTSSMGTAASLMSSFTSSLPNTLSSFNDLLLLYGREKKDLAVFVFYAVVMLAWLLYVAGAALQFRGLVQGAMALSALLVIALTIICSIVMVVITLLGDLCMDPTNNLLRLSPDGSAKDALLYYSSCQGSNLLGDYMVNASHYLSLLNTTIQALTNSSTAPCPFDPNLQATLPFIAQTQSTLLDIDAVTDCTSTAPAWASLLNQGICGDGFTGFFSIWICMFVVSGALFLTLCVSSVLYQYFGDYWRLKPEDVLPSSPRKDLEAPSPVFTPPIAPEVEMSSIPVVEVTHESRPIEGQGHQGQEQGSGVIIPPHSRPQTQEQWWVGQGRPQSATR